jgi:hypothetical protein
LLNSLFKEKKKINFVLTLTNWGVSLAQREAEMIPIEPEQGNACEGSFGSSYERFATAIMSYK